MHHNCDNKHAMQTICNRILIIDSYNNFIIGGKMTGNAEPGSLNHP